MGTAVGTFSARSNHRIRLETQLVSQNVAGNYSTVNWQLYAEKTSSSSSYYLTAGGSGTVTIAGNSYGVAAWSYDFRSNTIYTLASGTINIGHNADGTQSYNYSASITAAGSLGSASCTGADALPTIARASNATFSPSPMVAGSAATIYTNRASSSFTHTVTYAFGSQSGTIGTGVGDSVAWTPPLGLLTEIPNALSGVGTITTTTYSGGTTVGSTAIPFTLSTPASVVPTISSITATEAVSAVASSVGVFVQGLSKLNLAIVGAAGAYGSTIASSTITVDGQIISAASGTTGVIASSGTLTVTATVTDSRGRATSATTSVVVLPYATPTISSSTVSVKRSYVDGTLNDNGTYIKVAFTSGVQSLKNGATEKNSLTYRVSTRQHGNVAWNIISTVSPGGIAFTGSKVVGTYDIAHSWDVLIEVYDLFATTALASTVATASIFMHWDASLGMGVGKYHENGMLDVGGDVYATGGKLASYFIPQNTNAPMDPPTSYPVGTSTQLVNPAAGWPFDAARYGTLVTVRGYDNPTGYGTIQYWSDYQLGGGGADMVFFRQWFYQATAWTAWATVNSPAGQITQYAGAAAPPGHLLCQGQAVSRTAYARLYAVCGTVYGAGDGSSTFNVPDMRGRVPVGQNSSGTFANMNASGGEETHLLTVAEMPSHTHNFAQYGTTYSAYYAIPPLSGQTGATAFNGNFGMQPTGGGGAHNNLQPYRVLNFIIKT